MLKRNITYTNFNGEQVTKTFYFNLSKSELIEMEFRDNEGFAETLRRIVKTEDNAGLVKEFKALILAAYGERSEDGERFIKSDELREAFAQTAAYDALFMELSTQANAAAVFIQGILPADLALEEVIRQTGEPAPAPAVQAPPFAPPPPPMSQPQKEYPIDPTQG